MIDNRRSLRFGASKDRDLFLIKFTKRHAYHGGKALLYDLCPRPDPMQSEDSVYMNSNTFSRHAYPYRVSDAGNRWTLIQADFC